MTEYEEKQIQFLAFEIKNNSQESFKEFFELLQPSIYNYLYRYVFDKDAAEELTQESFVKFWVNRANIDANQSPKAYLYKIAGNLAYTYLEKNKRFDSLDNEEILINLSKDPTMDYEMKFLMDDYEKAIQTLPERCKAIFLLSRYEGFDYTEIAEILGISLQTVKNQMNKALSSLRKQLSKYLQ